jgi:hypothetical protein
MTTAIHRIENLPQWALCRTRLLRRRRDLGWSFRGHFDFGWYRLGVGNHGGLKARILLEEDAADR